MYIYTHRHLPLLNFLARTQAHGHASLQAMAGNTADLSAREKYEIELEGSAS